MKIIDELRWGETELKSKGVENPRLDADLLMGAVLDLTRDRLYLERDRVLAKEEETRFAGFIARRQAREPLQYILQRQEFMGLKFYVDERVLIPRPETEGLAIKFLESVPVGEASGLRVLDLCTGSGILAITTAALRPGVCVVGTDVSFGALEVARMNALRLGVAVEWRQGDFLQAARGEFWDWIVCNPPYVSEEEYAACAPEIRFEPRQAFLGGQDGLDFYRRLAIEAPPILGPGGRLLLEIGWQQAEAVCTLLQNQGLQTEVFSDLAQRDRVILAR